MFFIVGSGNSFEECGACSEAVIGLKMLTAEQCQRWQKCWIKFHKV